MRLLREKSSSSLASALYSSGSVADVRMNGRMGGIWRAGTAAAVLAVLAVCRVPPHSTDSRCHGNQRSRPIHHLPAGDNCGLHEVGDSRRVQFRDPIEAVRTSPQTHQPSATNQTNGFIAIPINEGS